MSSRSFCISRKSSVGLHSAASEFKSISISKGTLVSVARARLKVIGRHL